MERTAKIDSVLKEVAAEGVAIHVDGTCMSPYLDDASLIRIANRGSILPGDILVYRSDDGRLVVHRLLGYYRRRGEWWLLLQADSATRPDRAVRREQVLGRVADGKVSIRQRLWALSRYLRYALMSRRCALGRRSVRGEGA